MHAHSLALSYGSIPLLDDEFDKGDNAAPMVEHTAVAPVVLGEDLAWDDQLDEGYEVSL